MSFPPELYRLIIREATCAPGALDTSYDAILHEDREAILESIGRSLNVKCALCLVSKAFYDLTEEYLYEIIIFRRFDHISRVVNTLTHCNGRSPGRWCRRLDIYLSRCGDAYQGVDWDGSAILWGLIPLCPNVTVFSFHGWYVTESVRNCTAHGNDCPLVPSAALWKIIAMAWASSLRRIEMSGIWMRADRFELFIRYFRNLQVCRITTIEPFYPELQIFDGDEKPIYRLARGFRRRIHKSIRFMSPEALAMLHQYKTTAAWPSYDGNRPYMLPSLHTLHLDHFPHLLSHFCLPSVRFLGGYDLMCLNNLVRTMPSEFHHISSTFSSSLARFTWGSEHPVDFGHLFDMLPYLTHLKILVQCDYAPQSMVAPHRPQTTVTHMDIIEMSRTNLKGITSIISFVQSALFPNLKSISISCRDEQLQAIKDILQNTGLSVSGVSIQISGGLQSIFTVLPRSPLYP